MCVCVRRLCADGWGRLVGEEKEQINGAEREIHFSNVILPCHPLSCEGEPRDNNLRGNGKRTTFFPFQRVSLAVFSLGMHR